MSCSPSISGYLLTAILPHCMSKDQFLGHMFHCWGPNEIRNTSICVCCTSILAFPVKTIVLLKLIYKIKNYAPFIGLLEWDTYNWLSFKFCITENRTHSIWILLILMFHMTGRAEKNRSLWLNMIETISKLFLYI